MTRINVVPPSELTREHLVAEYRELPRIFGLILKRQNKNQRPVDCKIPAEYRLGAGHVLFFYDKVMFLINRQRELIEEMRARGYTVNYDNPEQWVHEFNGCWLNDYEPTPEALAINRERIQERINGNS